MADRDELQPGDEDGGGEVKSFLDHLEDLRWTLIKSAACIGVCMMVCLPALVDNLNVRVARAEYKSQLWIFSIDRGYLAGPPA